MITIREMRNRLFQWRAPRLPGWLAALLWWILLAFVGIWAGFCFKRPDFLFLRVFETPLMLVLVSIAIWGAWRIRKVAARSSRKLESGLRLALGILLAALVLGQEGWFRWQQYQILRGDAELSRIGQHFVVGFWDFDDVKPLVERGLIGGIYITRRNLEGETIASLKNRIDELQALRVKAGLPPLFVMADQEGGKVSHLSPLLARMPPLSSLLDDGMENLELRARAYGEQQGLALAGAGINMNLAPVVDLKIEPTEKWKDRHTLIGQRAIADDPWIVASIAAAYGKGLLASGVQPTVKHFPGLGRVNADTHLVKASLTLDPAEQSADWLPFREVTARTGAAMMLAHVRLPDIDPEKPVSLSRIVVQDVLRKEGGGGWNFQGLLITDDLNMGAVYNDGIGQAAIAALDAGVDLILISYDPDQYYRALYAAWKAWKRGSINADREIESANRLTRYWRQKQANSNRN
ncbi:MAG: glycoside hydrolase family 3 protein [Betaproteobacteria bacterium]|nr:glycoside hydrolase family 3 protein [Betaproteobacteria bacterium]